MKQKLTLGILLLLTLMCTACSLSSGEKESAESLTANSENSGLPQGEESESFSQTMETKIKEYYGIKFEYPTSFAESESGNKLTITNGQIPVMEVIAISTEGKEVALKDIEAGIKGYVASGVNDEIIENPNVQLPVTFGECVSKAYTAIWAGIPMQGEITGFYYNGYVYMINFINLEENSSIATYKAIAESVEAVK